MAQVQVPENYKVHPVYNLYCGNGETGQVMHLLKLKPIKENRTATYYQVSVRAIDGKPKSIYTHRFIWECYNGVIDKTKGEIDHIDNNKHNNKLSNLQLITRKENVIKSAKMKNTTNLKDNHKKRKAVKSICEDGTLKTWYSLGRASVGLNINPGVISQCLRGLNNCKSANSKLDHKNYTFQYSDEVIEKPKGVRKPYKERNREYKQLKENKKDNWYSRKYANDPEFRAKKLKEMRETRLIKKQKN